MDLKQSTASQEILLGPFLDDDDGVTQKTGLTIANTDIKIFKAGGTTLGNKNSGGATEIATGFYYATLDATDTNTLGLLVVVVQMTDCLCVRHEFNVVSAAYYEWKYGSTIPKVDVDTIKTQAVTCAAGVTVLAQVGAAGAPGANNGLVTTNGTKVNQTVDLTAGQSIACSDKTGFSLAATGADLILKSSTFVQAIVAAINEFATYGLTALNTLLVTTGIKVGSIANNAITANAINDGAITNAKVADDVDVNAKTVTAGVIAADVWNAATSGYGGAGTYGQAVEDILADTNELQVDDTPTAVAAVKTVVDAVKVQTDKLTFTVANQVDANIQYINDTAVTGDGGTTPWGPA